MRMIAHSYDSYDEAVKVVQALEAAGVPHDDISLVSGDKDRTVATTTTGDTTTGAGTGASIGTLVGGGAGLLAGIGMLAIPGVGPVVAAGWLIATLTGAGVGAAAGGLLGSLTGAGISEADATTYADHVGRGGTLVTVRSSDEMATEVEYILEHGTAHTAMAAAAPVLPHVTAPVTAPVVGADGKIQVVEENLVVGKRDVASGGVRVTTSIIETPVEEQVRLREERVTIERRPVNQPLTGVAADAFRSRTIAATATSEEAVVGKTARVVEEIGIRKDASERVETVSDTVRSTKVDVENVPGTVTTGTTTVGTSGTGVAGNTLRDNPATRAVDGSLNTNLSGENPKI